MTAAGLLVALAASSGPLVTTAAASSALKDELAELTPLATGLQITGLGEPAGPVSSLIRRSGEREQAVGALAVRLGLERPVFTVETALPLTLSTRTGDVPLNLLARSGALEHVKGPGEHRRSRRLRLRPHSPARPDHAR